MKWRNLSDTTVGVYSDPDNNWYDTALVRRVVSGEVDGPVYHASGNGQMSMEPDALFAEASEFGAPVFMDTSSGASSRMYATPDGMAVIHAFNDGRGNANISTLARDAHARFVEKLAKWFCSEDGSTLYVLESEHGDTSFVPLKIEPVPLVRENYQDDVLAAYDHVRTDLAAAKPCGKLSLMEGEPGTGKTHLVRGLMANTDGCVFAVVPPHMVQNFADPSFIPVVMRFAKRKDGKRAVFILEDADSALVPRATDNMAAISTMLNISDGIMGSLVDIRLVVTTNAKKVEIDKALTRPGRMCRHLHVGKISGEQATAVCVRAGGARVFDGPATLAEAYAASRTQ